MHKWDSTGGRVIHTIAEIFPSLSSMYMCTCTAAAHIHNTTLLILALLPGPSLSLSMLHTLKRSGSLGDKANIRTISANLLTNTKSTCSWSTTMKSMTVHSRPHTYMTLCNCLPYNQPIWNAPRKTLLVWVNACTYVWEQVDVFSIQELSIDNKANSSLFGLPSRSTNHTPHHTQPKLLVQINHQKHYHPSYTELTSTLNWHQHQCTVAHRRNLKAWGLLQWTNNINLCHTNTSMGSLFSWERHL